MPLYPTEDAVGIDLLGLCTACARAAGRLDEIRAAHAAAQPEPFGARRALVQCPACHRQCVAHNLGAPRRTTSGLGTGSGLQDRPFQWTGVGAIPAQPSPLPPRAASVSLRDSRVMKINPTGRRVESIGDDRRDFNHSASAATVVQELHVSNQTQFLVGVDMDRTRASNGQAGLKFLDIVTAQKTIENTLVQQHSASVQRSLTVDQTATITIPARTHLVATLHWMRTWEDGVVVLGSAAGPVAEVPYSVTVGLHFDMTTEDVTA